MAEFYWPNGTKQQPTVSSPYGMRINPVTHARAMHYGTDFVGFRVNKSITDGTVTHVGTPAGWAGGGVQVWVRNSDGSLARYMHMVKGSTRVKVGDRVKGMQALGTMGMTGRASGIHLHLEIVPKGQTAAVNCVPYIKARLAAPSGGGVATAPFNPALEQEEDDMLYILERTNTNASKSLYNVNTGKAIREISREENTAFRGMQARGEATYITVSDAEYKQRGGF